MTELLKFSSIPDLDIDVDSQGIESSDTVMDIATWIGVIVILLA